MFCLVSTYDVARLMFSEKINICWKVQIYDKEPNFNIITASPVK